MSTTKNARVVLCPNCKYHANIIVENKKFSSRDFFSMSDGNALVKDLLKQNIITEEEADDLDDHIAISDLPADLEMLKAAVTVAAVVALTLTHSTDDSAYRNN